MAVISFLKAIAAIRKSSRLDKYRQREDMQTRVPNYQVKMGFGMNVGWAIEGAIGSEFKIDASYLSPNVNLASRLQSATKFFGVPLLLSGQLQSILTDKCKTQLRHIDTIKVKGSTEPIKIYTCDVNPNILTIERPTTSGADYPDELTHKEEFRRRIK